MDVAVATELRRDGIDRGKRFPRGEDRAFGIEAAQLVPLFDFGPGPLQ